MFASTLVTLLAFSTSAFAGVYVTSPIATTSFPAGQAATLSWEDDGTAPSLAQFGPSIISIYVGNALQQTSLQTIAPSVDVSTETSLQFTPDATIGPNGGEYFIRFESISLKDATSPQYPALAFSAKFTLSGMTGTFSGDVQSEIDGQSTAPLAAAASTSAAGATTAGATTASVTTTGTPSSASKTSSGTSKSGSSTHSSASATTSAKNNGAVAAFATGPAKMWLGVLLGAAVGVMAV